MSVTGDNALSPSEIRFAPLDPDQVRLLLRLSHELGFKFVEEIERAKQSRPRP